MPMRCHRPIAGRSQRLNRGRHPMMGHPTWFDTDQYPQSGSTSLGPGSSLNQRTRQRQHCLPRCCGSRRKPCPWRCLARRAYRCRRRRLRPRAQIRRPWSTLPTHQYCQSRARCAYPAPTRGGWTHRGNQDRGCSSSACSGTSCCSSQAAHCPCCATVPLPPLHEYAGLQRRNQRGWNFGCLGQAPRHPCRTGRIATPMDRAPSDAYSVQNWLRSALLDRNRQS